jgi:hypothetical protein
MRERAVVISALLPMVWLGFVLAISFMEAPLKFTAPQASYTAALSIGQVVFRALTRVELAFLAVLTIAGLLSRWEASVQAWLWAIVGVVVAQRVFLLPALEARMEAVLAGRTMPPERLVHALYIAGECLKVLLLPGLSWSLVRTLHVLSAGAGHAPS